MGSKAGKRRQAAIRKIQQAAGVDRDLAEHMYDKQVAPQLHAAERRQAGEDVDLAFVNVAPGASGHTVTCAGCGRTARLAHPIPEGSTMLCPNCIRRRDALADRA